MDKIWYRNPSKSEVIDRCGGDEKPEWKRTQNRQKSNAKKNIIKNWKKIDIQFTRPWVVALCFRDCMLKMMWSLSLKSMQRKCVRYLSLLLPVLQTLEVSLTLGGLGESLINIVYMYCFIQWMEYITGNSDSFKHDVSSLLDCAKGTTPTITFKKHYPT